jgi:hypothetical protein
MGQDANQGRCSNVPLASVFCTVAARVPILYLTTKYSSKECACSLLPVSVNGIILLLLATKVLHHCISYALFNLYSVVVIDFSVTLFLQCSATCEPLLLAGLVVQHTLSMTKGKYFDSEIFCKFYPVNFLCPF